MGQSLRRALLIDDSYRLPKSSSAIDLWGGNGGDGDEAMDTDDDEAADEVTETDSGFPDLTVLPPEIALTVLSNLNATDLCLAACVWQKLASDEILWQGLCREQWQHATVYDNYKNTDAAGAPDMSYRKVFLLLDEGTLTFNSDPEKVAPRDRSLAYSLQLYSQYPSVYRACNTSSTTVWCRTGRRRSPASSTTRASCQSPR